MKDLATMTVKQLRDVAKEHAITGRWDMNKEELIKAITDVTTLSHKEVPNEDDCIIKEEGSTNPEGSQKVTKSTLEYLSNAVPGTLVAFKRNNKDIAMSGKFVSCENGKVVIESKKGTLFKVSPENIIWVKTGTRWPKWVFALFNKEVGVDNAIS